MDGQFICVKGALGKPNALVPASDVAFVGINVGDMNEEYSNKSGAMAPKTDSGVEMENTFDLFENSNTVTVETLEESIASDYFSDSESVKSVESPSPYVQRRAYVGRPAFKCCACKKWSHIARYCLVDNNMQRKSQYPKTTPRHYDVFFCEME